MTAAEVINLHAVKLGPVLMVATACITNLRCDATVLVLRVQSTSIWLDRRRCLHAHAPDPRHNVPAVLNSGPRLYSRPDCWLCLSNSRFWWLVIVPPMFFDIISFWTFHFWDHAARAFVWIKHGGFVCVSAPFRLKCLTKYNAQFRESNRLRFIYF